MVLIKVSLCSGGIVLQAIYLALAVVVCYGFYLGIKSMIQLFRAGGEGKGLFWRYLIFFLLAPCIFLAVYYIIYIDNPNIWIGAPLLLLIVIWFLLGYFIRSAYQHLGIAKKTSVDPKRIHLMLSIAIAMVIVGLVIWLLGYFYGFPGLSNLWINTLVILSIYFIFYGIILLRRQYKAWQQEKIVIAKRVAAAAREVQTKEKGKSLHKQQNKKKKR